MCETNIFKWLRYVCSNILDKQKESESEFKSCLKFFLSFVVILYVSENSAKNNSVNDHIVTSRVYIAQTSK